MTSEPRVCEEAGSPVPDDVDAEEKPKPKSGEEAKTARSMDAMQAGNEATTAADVDDAKLASVGRAVSELTVGHDFVGGGTEEEGRRRDE
jgi:hypothetical protein